MNNILKYFFMCLCSFLLFNSVIGVSHANEPIMEYKYSLEKYKIDRARFIWEAALNEMVIHRTITKEEKANIKLHINKSMNKRSLSETQYDTERKALSISNVDVLVYSNIINKEQGNELRYRLDKYDLRDLE